MKNFLLLLLLLFLTLTTEQETVRIANEQSTTTDSGSQTGTRRHTQEGQIPENRWSPQIRIDGQVLGHKNRSQGRQWGIRQAGSEAGSQEFEVKACERGWVEFICSYPDTNQKYQAADVLFEGPSVEESKPKGLSVFHNKKSKNLKVIIKQLGTVNSFGEYECRFFLNSGRKEQVEVKVEEETNVCSSRSTQTVNTGAQTNITCNFPEYPYKTWVKFLCKNNLGSCEDILTTESPQKPIGRFSFKKISKGFNVSISNVSKQDKGVYWCGLKHSDGSYRMGFKRIQLRVQDSPDEPFPSETTTISETPPTSPKTTSASTPCKTTTTASGTTPTSSSSPSVSESKPVIPMLITVVVLLIIVIIVYTSFRCFKNRKEGQVKTEKEERTYEEIQERPPQSNSGTVLNSIYTTAQHPTVPSAPAQHSSSTGTSSGEVNNQTYSTALDATQSPPDSIVKPPPTSSEDPFYSTLSNHSSPEEGPH